MQCIHLSFLYFLKRIYTFFFKLFLYHEGIKYIFYQNSSVLCEFCMAYKKQKQNNVYKVLIHVSKYMILFANIFHSFEIIFIAQKAKFKMLGTYSFYQIIVFSRSRESMLRVLKIKIAGFFHFKSYLNLSHYKFSCRSKLVLF